MSEKIPEKQTVVDHVMLGQRLRQARKQRKLTQGELAKQLGISTAYVGHIERGVKNCSLEIFAACCRALNLDANLLLFGADTAKPTQREIVRRWLETALNNLNDGTNEPENPSVDIE